jgi:hypothetical protein
MPSTEQRIIDMAAYAKVTKGGEGNHRKIQLDVYVDPSEAATGWIKVSGVSGVGLSIRFQSDDALTWIMTNLVREIGSAAPSESPTS